MNLKTLYCKLKPCIDLNSFFFFQGTLKYCAPEILRGGGISEKADVYSFGVTMWQVLHQETPYDSEDLHVVIYKVEYCRLIYFHQKIGSSSSVVRSIQYINENVHCNNNVIKALCADRNVLSSEYQYLQEPSRIDTWVSLIGNICKQLGIIF